LLTVGLTAGSFIVGNTYTIASVGTTSFTAIGAASNTVGVTFVATGVGSGTGTAYFGAGVSGTITSSQYLYANTASINAKITGGSALSWTIGGPPQTIGSVASPVAFIGYGPLLNQTAASTAAIAATGLAAGGWVNITNDSVFGVANAVRTPMVSYSSPLQLANILWASNISALVGTLGTQSDANIAVTGGAMSGVTLSNSTLNSSTIGSTTTATTQTAGDNSTKVATTAYVNSAVTVGMPPGAVMTFAMNAAPAGWLAANGDTVSRTTYAALFSAIGTTFGAGDGSTTFKLPDLRGYFARGVDNGRGVDSGRAFGSNQDATGIADQAYQTVTIFYDNNDGPLYGGVTYNSSGGYAGTNRNIQKFKVRPYNIALLYCIKT
jgi:hypothetical protein